MENESNRYGWITWAILLVVAVLLRILPLGSIPLYNDELSALSRLDHSSLGELIEEGIKPDGHPAGVQLFLYGWQKLVGKDEFMLRLPFVLLSLGSILLLYLILLDFFHRTAALLATTFYSVIQYSLYYGIQIRPYAPGVFFVLLMTWALQQIWLRKGKGYSLFWWIFMLAGVLTGYMHYFAGLEALVLGLLALSFLRKQQKFPILMAGLGAVLLYLPHLPIFLAQVKTGGIGGWLPVPGLDFFRSYLSYILHHSWKFGLLVLFSWMLGVSQKFSAGEEQRHFRRFAGLAFVLPIAIGFAYSRLVNPVLHEGSAYFAFPFLLIFAASFIPKLSVKWMRFWFFCLMITGLGSLIFERQHFDISTQRGMEQVLEDHQDWEGLGVPFLLACNDSAYPGFYEGASHAIFQPEPASYIDFRRDLEAMNCSRMGLAWVNKPLELEFVAIAREFFPYIKYKKEYFVSEYYGLDAEAGGLEGINAWKVFYLNKGENINGDLSSFMGRREVLSMKEFTPAISLLLDTLGNNWNQWQYWASVEYFGSEVKDARLVLSFQIGDSVLHQEEMSLGGFHSNPETWNWCHKVVRAKHSPFKTRMPQNVQLKVYLWNPDRKDLKVSELKLEIWKGNRRLYGLFERVVQP